MRAVEPEILVLCYHGISPTWPAETTVLPDDFAAQLGALVARGWKGETLVDALTAPSSERVLVVTFDDAHRSVRQMAAPLMQQLGIPGTVFVPTDYAGTDRPMGWDGYDSWLGTVHEDELLCMSWEDLRNLSASGWEIGSHTCSHPHLTELSDADLAMELRRSREVCEAEMGHPCRSVAYPYSHVDDRVLRAARDAGYELGVTVPVTAAGSLPLAWPRVGVYRGEGSRRTLMRVWRRRHPSADRALVVPARALRSVRGRLRRGR